MYTIIGLGSAGCNIAELFENNPEYKVKLIDVEIEGDNCFSMQGRTRPEEYEKNTPDLSHFFNDVSEKVFFIMAGGGKISGASLKILQQLNNKELNIIYIRPDTEMIGSVSKMQDRVTFNVLQQYARSGVFKNIFLFSNPIIENIIGDIPIMQIKQKINGIIFNSINAILRFNDSEAIIDNSNPPKEVSRIISLGIFDINKNSEQLFYPIELIDDKCYYFAINDNELKSNGKLFKIIKDQMKEKVLDNTKISYRIYSTPHDSNYCYVVAYSKKVQE